MSYEDDRAELQRLIQLRRSRSDSSRSDSTEPPTETDGWRTHVFYALLRKASHPSDTE
jgi:hypothetical protein